jgi:hypothetical protein
MITGEYLLQYVLLGAFRSLQADSSQCGQFLQTLALLFPDVYTQAVAWFATQTPTVTLGYPMEPPAAANAIIAITLGGEQESDQFVGSHLDEDDEFSSIGDGDFDADDGGSQTWTAGSEVAASYTMTVYAANQNLCVWVAKAIEWALLKNRELIAQLGISEQRFSAQDVRPDENLSPDDIIVFKRAVGFSGKYLAIAQTVYTDRLQSVTVTVNDPTDPAHPFLPDN